MFFAFQNECFLFLTNLKNSCLLMCFFRHIWFSNTEFRMIENRLSCSLHCLGVKKVAPWFIFYFLHRDNWTEGEYTTNWLGNVMILRSKTSKWFFVGFDWEMERKLHSFGHEARAKDIFVYNISWLETITLCEFDIQIGVFLLPDQMWKKYYQK